MEEKVYRQKGEHSQRQGHLGEFSGHDPKSCEDGGHREGRVELEEPGAAARRPKRVDKKDQVTKMDRLNREGQPNPWAG